MTSRDTRRLDEDDVRNRPTRHGSRARTKQRPAHDDAGKGTVITVDRGRFTVLLEDGQVQITAMRARELGRTAIVVGDQVDVVGDRSGQPDSLARIVRVDERRTVLRRTADDNDPYERVIVANADQLLIVAALADPPPVYGLIDRCVVAALSAGLEPILLLTKADLAGPEEVLANYQPLDIPAVVTRRGADLGPVQELLDGKVTVFVGHSGVGKSTLVNALVPGAARSTGVVSGAGKGRHTSTSVFALPLPAPLRGWVIDTPGSGPSASPTSAPRTCCGPFRTSRTARCSVPAAANTSRPPTDAVSTPGSRPATPARFGWPPSAGCWSAAPIAADRRAVSRAQVPPEHHQRLLRLGGVAGEGQPRERAARARCRSRCPAPAPPRCR